MRVFHRTYSPTAILLDGFHDSDQLPRTTGTRRGVWVADVPLDDDDVADGAAYLVLDIPDDVLAEYEWIAEHEWIGEEAPRCREFLVPADILNQNGPPRLVPESESPSCRRL